MARALAGRVACLSVWGLPWSALVAGAASSLPVVAGMCARRRAGLKEAALLVRLCALHKLLGRASKEGDETVLLDEGAVFALAKLGASGCVEKKRADGATREQSDVWASEFVVRWASRVDAIVWLDAPDEVLARRIRERAKPHRMKHQSDDELFEFLARYRAAYGRVLSELSARYGVRVRSFSTEHESPERIASSVLASVRGESVTA